MKRKLFSFKAFYSGLVLMASISMVSCSKEESLFNDESTTNNEQSYEVITGNQKAFTVASADGFAKGTTGGSGGTAVTAGNATDFKKYAESSTKYIITVSASMNLGSVQINVNSNKTIIGASSSITLTGCLRLSGKTNVIFQNLNVTNPSGVGTGDGIEVSGSTKVFITKCTFTDCADGEVDVVRASDYVTVSWCKFQYVKLTAHNLSNLIGNSDDATGDRGKLHVTMHHNWYAAGVKERMPRVRFGQVHCYNNYYGSSGSNYCIGIGNESSIRVQNCYFDGQGNTWKDQRSSTSIAYTFSQTGNAFVNCSAATWAKNSTVSWPTYSYSMLAATDVKSKVTGGAGNR